MIKPPDEPKQKNPAVNPSVNPAASSSANPADIAREAFRTLASRRIAPTPDAYRKIYDEIAGIKPGIDPESILVNLSKSFAAAPSELSGLRPRLDQAAKAQDWQEYSKQLSSLIEKCLKPTTAPKTIEPAPAPQRIVAVTAVTTDGKQESMLRDLLSRTLMSVASLLQSAPQMVKETEALAQSLKGAQTDATLNDVAARLKQLCFKIEIKSGDMAEQQELLMRLFKLLLENVSELIEDDSWLHGQVEGVQKLLAGPIDPVALKNATSGLKEVIYKQSMLKHSLSDSKTTVKNMMLTFVDRLGAVASSAGDYHQKIDVYSRKISKTQDVTTLKKLMEEVMHETRNAQTEALQSRDAMMTAKHEVQEAEARIQDLQNKLEQMSVLVHEDQLTGSLNRRGLDDVLEREIARAERRQSPLCVAMLDLDDFKRLNDTHGHLAGDEALIHLVRVIKETLRTMDVIARFGGEEFLIVLPDTPLEEAKQTVVRVQRELTKRIFMHNDERLLMTFSAGVALRVPGEDQPSMISRADAALYMAKKAGKNRVIAAE